jgi:lysophospholipase L1-like esterase
VVVSVDDGAEQEVSLDAPAGPAALELVSAAPLSLLRLRLLEGSWRLHGLELRHDSAPALLLDVFGYPGATAASWKLAELDYFGAWFGARDYDLVMLEFGTNEGADARFDAAAYRQMLTAAVTNLRATFPAAACVLIGPGDRGVLVRRSSKAKRKNGKAPAVAKKSAQKKNARPAPAVDVNAPLPEALLRFSRVHGQIARIQQEVAAGQGCLAWNAFEAMGGAGSAYRWAREKPPLMAADLTHFTIKGYQKLGEMFATNMGWSAARIWPQGLPAR